MPDTKDLLELFKAIASLEDRGEAEMFLLDLCTPAELAAMSDRWKAVRMLDKGIPYREIYGKTGVSTATVTRVARCLSMGAGGYRLMLGRTESPKERLKNERRKPNSHRDPKIGPVG